MVKVSKRRRLNDPSAGGKRSAMAPDSGAPGLLETDDGSSESREGANGLSFRRGAEVIATQLKTLSESPGVYRMLNAKGEALYVGKARNLRKRVSTYAQMTKLPYRLQRMVSETYALEVVATHTEVEALLLESNLIKRLMPRFNVLLRDDKSFPYILITGDHTVPQITKHRGAHTRDGEYFGPFASAGAVNRTITALEKAFLLRSCSDAVFSSRRRPCLMFQIKRCAAPCVGKISEAAYGGLVRQAKDFLTGRSQDIQEKLGEAMLAASDTLDFEAAAVYRDRLKALAHIQSRQDINLENIDDADVMAAHQEADQTCIQVFFFRAGRNYGNRAYFPSHHKHLEAPEVLGAFVAQFYDDKPVPKLVLLSHDIPEQTLVGEALSQRSGNRVQLYAPKRGGKRKLVKNALLNATDALGRRLAESSAQRRLLDGVAELFGLDSTPERVEVYDNSHIQGADPYGAMVVAGPEGFIKSAYRKFKIKGESVPGGAEGPKAEQRPLGGDDYAMMREVLTRRFSRVLKEDPERESGQWPDLVLLDGGRGQLNAAAEVMADLGLGDLSLAAIAKGPDRDAGRERIFIGDRPPIMLEPRDPVLYFLQRLRDEAHRFVIGSHRTGRRNARLRSELDEVPGIGAKRKKALLLRFGSARAVSRAGLADLQSVDGISKTVAQRIYDHFQGAR